MAGRGLPLGGLTLAALSVASWVLLLCLLTGPVSSESVASASGPSSAGNTAAVTDDDNNLDFYKRLYDFGLGKRAYSYVSEYKRLPVYNFGLGKRADRLYSFGLGKRDKSFGRQYSFGIGKRDWDEEEDPDEDAAEENGAADGDAGPSWEDGEIEWSPEETKRARQMYSFGLGKRARQMYGFGLGKRARTYSFGIGKRYPRYGFGLGKRAEDDDYYYGGSDDNDGVALEGEMPKRRDHRFSFGLGKREISGQDEQENAKRGGYYDFGIGKRSDSARLRSSGQGSSFGRAGRRTYSFGLGKRLPMYDFGIGKRSESTVATEPNAAAAAEGESSGKH
ncbi:allatostatins [Ischnura elegans]|uniref:allatostatins n=1 Tax=Ischnura elegans TaxID=197161 RepID=UPI001ED89F5A|nr:allatostatins [Ischnura elegans]